MTDNEKEVLFRALSEMIDVQIKICDGLHILDSYDRDNYSKLSYDLWYMAHKYSEEEGV